LVDFGFRRIFAAFEATFLDVRSLRLAMMHSLAGLVARLLQPQFQFRKQRAAAAISLDLGVLRCAAARARRQRVIIIIEDYDLTARIATVRPLAGLFTSGRHIRYSLLRG
jgi:hypothetical protein